MRATSPTWFAGVRRLLEQALPPGSATSADSPTLDIDLDATAPPRVVPSELLEDAEWSVHPVPSPEAGFAAFLDGVQESRAASYVNGVPIVAARVAAAIRQRVDRRLVTWAPGPRVLRRIYAPISLLPATVVERLPAGLDVVDTLNGGPGEPDAHPLDLLRRALERVKTDREATELALSEAWCGRESAPLYVDGGLPRGERSAVSRACVGVVKTHLTIYAAGDALRRVLALEEGMRSSVFRVARNRRPDVASWYLRIRDRSGRDPTWGLVRVEVALDRSDALSRRADEVSRWIMAERAPVSLPDSRWDTLAYGVHDCEVYLRAL